MAERAYEIIAQQPIYRGFFNLTRLRLRHTRFDGGWSQELERELFHRGRCVAVLPYDPETDQVVLIEQFRVGALGVKSDPWLLEIIAGAIEDGESPEQVAHREAFEEAGCHLRELLRIGEFFPTPGACSERLTLFCGLVDATGIGGIHGLAAEDEDIRVTAVDFAAAMAWLEEGRIDTAVAIIGLQWLALNRDRLRADPA